MMSTAFGVDLVITWHDANAQAAVQSVDFSIPAGPLGQALAVFGRQSGLQVTHLAAVTAGKASPGFAGRAIPEQALAAILAGSGLTYSFLNAKTVAIAAPLADGGPVAADGSMLLDPVEVSGRPASGAGFQGTPDWVYETPASVSVISREAILNNSTRNVRELFDTVAGVSANHSESQNPGISINIRGLQDQNRIVTMIDGARQSFQRTSHGTSQRTYVDTAFIRDVDIEKSGVSGVGGAGALGGVVNFRTIEADDLIEPGKQWGTEIDATTGTNAYDFNGSVSTAVRISDNLSVTAGVSYKDIGDYEFGKNGVIKQLDGLGGLTARDGAVIFSGLNSVTTLLKAEGNLSEDLSFNLSWMRNDVNSQQGGYTPDNTIRSDDQAVVNNTVSSSFEWDPDSPLLNVVGRLWYNRLDNDESRIYSDVTLPVTYSMESFGGSLENTSRFEVPFGTLSLNYGVEAFRDNGETETPDMDDQDLGYDGGYGFKGANPSGRRDMVSGFANVTLEHDDWLTLTGGLRYDYYRLAGSTVVHGWEQTLVGTPGQNCLLWRNGSCFRWEIPPSQTIVNTYPQYPVDVDMSGGALLPSATIAVKPFEWLQPFVTYSRTFRPPAITEALISGGHPLVAPVENAPNPWLEPEEAETWEIGANISRKALFTPGDTFRAKAVFFYRAIENYISMGKIYNEEAGRQYDTYVNLDGITYSKGIELEANYDAGGFYIGGSFTWLDMDWADTYTYLGDDSAGGGTYPASPSVLFVPPEIRFTIDAGVRFLERRLVLGGRVTHVGGTEPAYGQLYGNYVNEDYTVYDLYGSFAVTPNAKLRFAVNNVTDLAYVPALGTATFPAPGRTVTASLNLKF